MTTGQRNIEKIRERRPDGTFGDRKAGVWSSVAEACIDCGTIEQPHDCDGRCHTCYSRWRYQNRPEYADRQRERQRARYHANPEKAKAYEKSRQFDPRRRELRRHSSRRWADKNSKWPTGSVVYYELAAGIWVQGEIVSKTNVSAHVRFVTFEAEIHFKDLRKEFPQEAA